MTLREQILAANASALHPIEVPEWKLTVYAKALSVGDGIKLQAERKADSPDSVRNIAVLLSGMLCDESGARVFDKPEDLYELNQSILLKIFNAAMEFNGMTAEVEEADAGGILTQPLTRKAFELAERLGMTAEDVRTRMTLRELKQWIEWDETHHHPWEIQTALTCAAIRSQFANSDPRDYLRPIKEPPKPPKTFAEIDAMFRMRADRFENP